MRVLLDTCVLYPPSVRDFLLGLAGEDAFEVRISSGVLAELEDVLVRRAHLPTAAAARRVAEITNVAETFGVLHESGKDVAEIGRSIGLLDDDDAHLVDAALSADCDAILTFNLSDLPEERLASVGLESWHPDLVLDEMARMRHPALVRVASDLLQRITVYDRPSDIAPKLSESSLPHTGGQMPAASLGAAVEEHGRPLGVASPANAEGRRPEERRLRIGTPSARTGAGSVAAGGPKLRAVPVDTLDRRTYHGPCRADRRPPHRRGVPRTARVAPRGAIRAA